MSEQEELLYCEKCQTRQVMFRYSDGAICPQCETEYAERMIDTLRQDAINEFVNESLNSLENELDVPKWYLENLSHGKHR